jgi:hypothetical protein
MSKLAKQLEFGICTNDEWGQWTGRVRAVNLAVRFDDGSREDGALDLYCHFISWSDSSRVYPRCQVDGARGRVKLRRRWFPVTWYSQAAGHICWDAFKTDLRTGCRVLNYLRGITREGRCIWDLEGGWCELWERWQSEHDFSEADFNPPAPVVPLVQPAEPFRVAAARR